MPQDELKEWKNAASSEERLMKKIELKDRQEIILLPLAVGSGNLTLICCDCGLTHDIEVSDYYDEGLEGVKLIVHRNNRKTAWYRKQVQALKGRV